MTKYNLNYKRTHKQLKICLNYFLDLCLILGLIILALTDYVKPYTRKIYSIAILSISIA